MKLKLLSIIFSLQVCFSFSQNIRPYDIEKQAEHAKNKGYDPSYRVNYFENIIIRSFLNSDVASFQFRTLSDDTEYNIVPAAEYLIGASLDYKWIAVGVSFSPDFLKNNDFKGLDNESLKVVINFFFTDQWRQELSVSYLKGFLNTNETSSNADLQLLNNTTVTTYQGSTFYIANKNFSFRAHYAQTERQLRSAGSLIPKLSYSYTITEPNITSDVLENETLQLNSIDIIGQIGYIYTFVARQKWYATIGIHPGVGYNTAEYNLKDQSDRLFTNVTFALDNELSIGYNSYRWFFGLSGNWRNYDMMNNESDQFKRDLNYFKVHLGYRFNDNKPMRKIFGWFEDHLGF